MTSGTVGVKGGISIHSSLFNDVSVLVDGGRGGSDGSTEARDFSFRLSAVGIVVARG